MTRLRLFGVTLLIAVIGMLGLQAAVTPGIAKAELFFNMHAGVLGNGTISPSGLSIVPYGNNITYSMVADAGNQLTHVYVDGIDVGTPTTYTFTGVVEPHTIAAVFEPVPAGMLLGNVRHGLEGVSDVTVTLSAGLASTATTTTQEHGFYVFLGVAPGPYTVTYSKPGYITQTASVVVASNQQTRQDMALEPVRTTGSLQVMTYTFHRDQNLWDMASGATVTMAIPGGTLAGRPIEIMGITDARYMVFDDVPPGRYAVTSSLPGCVARTQDVTITAGETAAIRIFLEAFRPTLSYGAGPGGTVSGAATQTVEYGASGSPVTAVPDPGYHFVRWSDGVTNATRTDSNVTSDLSLTAEFTVSPVLATTTKLSGPKSVLLKRTLKLTGTVAPSTASGTVTVALSRKAGRKWVSAGTARVKIVAGKFGYSFAPKYRGSWAFSAAYAGAAVGYTTYRPSKSGVVSVTVK